MPLTKYSCSGVAGEIIEGQYRDRLDWIFGASSEKQRSPDQQRKYTGNRGGKSCAPRPDDLYSSGAGFAGRRIDVLATGLEISQQSIDILIALAGIFLKCLGNDLLQPNRNARSQLVYRLRLFVDDRVNNRVAVVTAKRRLPGEHFVDHGTERPDVGALVERVSHRLLRRHVGGCTDRNSWAGQRTVTTELRQAEIDDFRCAVCCNYYVGWFDVSVNNIILVCGTQTSSDLTGDIDSFFDLERAAGYRVLQAMAVEVGHGYKCRAVGLVDLVDGANVRMV